MAEAVVVPDGGGEGEDSLGDAGADAGGTDVYHTGLWMIPSRKYLFIGLLAEGEPPEQFKKPMIVVSDSDELVITDFFHGGAGGSDFGHHWILLARMDPEHAGRLSGATLTVQYESLGLEYRAQIANLTEQ